MRNLLRLWFTFERRVTRREYLLSGLALAVVKYAGDALIVYAATGRVWTPAAYLSSVSSLVTTTLRDAPPFWLAVLSAWSLPFLWIGISMSMRRALDAGRNAWLALLFFVPVVNYVFMLVMSVLPSAGAPRRAVDRPRPYERRLPGALLAIAAGSGFGLGMTALSVLALRSYGVALFLGTPFVLGALTAYVFNRRYPASGRETVEVVAITLAVVGGVLLLTATEGAVCLLMAAPLAVAIALVGGALGRALAGNYDSRLRDATFAVILLPVAATADAGRAATAEREVVTTIEIAAAPDVVWRNVIAFSPLERPTELAFRLGIAYPERAEIIGTGVGAVRYCVFSTGPFVEPITVWEPGRRLSFDVERQPPALREWSPYTNVAPPHLDGYFRARRGEFRLVPLEGGRTRLEGSTWYELRIFPDTYWMLIADQLVGRIHKRVLLHIKQGSERSTEREGPRAKR